MKWFSQELNITITKIERFQSGTIFLLELAKIFSNQHPQIVNIIQKQGNLKAKCEVDYLQNYKTILKILQECGIQSNYRTQSDLEKVMKGKINDCFEFMQFVRKLWEQHNTPSQKTNIIQQFGEIYIPGLDKDLQKKQLFSDSTNIQKYNSQSYTSQSKSQLTDQSNCPQNQLEKLMSKSYQVANDLESILQENSELKKMNYVQLVRTKTAEKERDFYFGKLRDIELLIIEGKRQPIELIQAMQKILFAKEDENIEVDEQGNIIV